MWEAFERRAAGLLVDEIDKADIEFPNDLLHELDRMEFYVYETRDGEGAPPARSSSSRATTKRSCRMRSCAAASFTTSAFRTRRPWSRSSRVHFPTEKGAARRGANAFFKVRETPGLKKKPSTSELLDWIKLLVAEDIPPEALRGDDPKKPIPVLHGALLKNEQDVHLFEHSCS